MSAGRHNLASAIGPNFAFVGRITEYRDVQRFLRVGETESGKWLLRWWEEELRSGEVKVIRQQVFATKAEADRLFKEWKREFQAPVLEFKKAMAESDPKQLIGQDAPGCEELTAEYLQGADKAARDELRRLYPRCVPLFDLLKTTPKENRGEVRARLARAYILDVAALTGHVIDETVPSQTDFIHELSAAILKGQKPREGKAVRDAAINADLRLNWIRLRYCFEPMEKLATIVNKRHNLRGRSRLTAAASQDAPPTAPPVHQAQPRKMPAQLVTRSDPSAFLFQHVPAHCGTMRT